MLLCSAGAAAGTIRKRQSRVQSPYLLSALFFQMLGSLGFFVLFSYFFPLGFALFLWPWQESPSAVCQCRQAGWFWEGGSAFPSVIAVLWLSLEVLMQIKWKTLQ